MVDGSACIDQATGSQSARPARRPVCSMSTPRLRLPAGFVGPVSSVDDAVLSPCPSPRGRAREAASARRPVAPRGSGLRVLALALAVVVASGGPSVAFAEGPVAASGPVAAAPGGVDVDELRAALQPSLEAAALARATVGVQVVRVADGLEVLGASADAPLLPASTTKLLTSAAALDVLGPSFNFTTDVYVDGPVEGGVLDGDLYVVPHADPTLTSERLWRLIRDVRLEGIARVDGDVIVDASYFDEGHLIPAWDNRDDLERGVTYFAPIGAAASDFGAVSVVTLPGAKEGDAADVQLGAPSRGYITVVNNAVTGRDGSRSRIAVEREVTANGLTLTVSGTIARDASPRSQRLTVGDPDAYTAAQVDQQLRDAGIKVTGSVHLGALPASGARRVHRMYSPPLSSVLMDTNKFSSNFMAEMVLRTLGAEVHGRGATDTGLEVVRAYLDRIGVPSTDYVIRNGSGLSRETRIPPSVLTAVLLDMAHDDVVGHEFVSTLSIAGKDGTLGGRMRDLAGVVRGKTGTLAGVHGLAGYVSGADGTLYAFAFLVNDVGSNLDAVKAAQDAFLRTLATFGAPDA